MLALLLASAGCGGEGAPTRPTVQQPIPSEPAAPAAPLSVPAPAPRLGKLRFLAFGDSVTYGTVSPALPTLTALDAGISSSYPFKLQALLTARYTDQLPVVLNAGLPRERVVDALPRFQTTVAAAGADVVILLEGANDLLAYAGNEPGTSIPLMLEGMKSIIREAKRRGLVVVVMTQPPQRAGTRGDGAPHVAEFNRDLRRLAEAEGSILVDVHSQFDLALQGGDGLHPTEAGYARIAEILLETIKARFELPATTASRAN